MHLRNQNIKGMVPKWISYLNNSNIGSPVHAFGYGILHRVDNVAAISVIFTCLGYS